MKTRRIVLALLTSFVFLLPAVAQEQSSITGTVKDADGGVLPGVEVSAKNVATGLVRSGWTNTEGRYSVLGLPPGTYDVTVRLSGFADWTLKGLTLVVGKSAPIHAVLKPAGIEQAISVVADRPILETTESDVSTAIPEELIRSLPITERNAITLALLAPGVSASPYFDPTKSRDNFDGVSFGAASGSENLVLVDGADNNDDVVGSILQFFPQDSIQEFELITSRFKAEYGHTDGGVVNMVTKSGTNAYSGGAYWLLRNDAFNSKSFVEEDKGTDKAEFNQHVVGSFLGGPVSTDRVHFFGNFDYTTRDKPLPLFTAGAVPQIDAQGSAPQDFEQALALGKVTAQLTDSNYLVLRYGFQDDEQLNPTLTSTSSIEHGSATSNRYHSLLAKNQTVIGGEKLNEFHYQLSDFTNNKSTNAAGHPLEFREIRAGRARLGHNVNLPQRTEQRKHQLVNNFSWRMNAGGSHDLKAGVEFQRVNLGGFFSTGMPFAQFNYASEADFVAGRAATSATIYNGVLFDVGEGANNIFAFFIQDDWKLTRRLTLNLGLRWDVEDNDWSQQDRTFVSADPLFFGAQPQTDKNNWGPRIGVAYDATNDGRLVLRGGYGLYYQQIFWNSPIRNVYLEGKLSDAMVVTAPAFNPSSPFCSGPNDRTDPTCIPYPSIPSPRAQDFVGRNFTGSDPNLKTPYTHQYSLGFGALLPGDWAVDVDYVRTRSDNQVYRTNVGGRATVNGLNTSQFGRAGRVNTQGARQEYDGLLLALRRRFDKLSAQLSYSYGNGQGHTARQTAILIDDRTDHFGDNFGPNFAQRDHIFSGSLTYRFPHDFDIGAIVKVQSGFAFTAFDPRLGDVDNDGSSSDTIAAGERRGDHRGDGFSQVDVRFAKKFQVGSLRPQVFFEVFNLLNAANEKPEAVDALISSPTFGTSTQVTGQSRTGQLSLRIDF